MPPFSEIADSGLSNRGFHHDTPRYGFTRVKRGREVHGMEQGQINSFLQIETMMHTTQEQDQLPLILLVTTWCTEY
jgi:hypothetical protein